MLAGVVTVADEDAFGVLDMRRLTGGHWRTVVIVMSGILLPGLFKADREMTLRRVLAEEDLGDGLAALLTRIPGVHESRNTVEPAVRIHAATCGEGDDGLLVSCDYGLDQLVLSPGQSV